MPRVTSPVGTIDHLLASSRENFVAGKELQDNIFDNIPLYYYMKRQNLIKKVDGGESFEIPLLYGTNSTAAWYSGYDILDTTPQDGITVAVYQWKEMAASVAMSGKELRQNGGTATRVFNLLDAKVKQARMTLEDMLNADTFSNSDGNGIEDLTTIIDVDTTVGGINSTTYTWWDAKVQTATDFNGVIGTGDGIPKMISAFNDATYRRDAPRLIVAHQTPYEVYEQLILPNERWVNDRDMADAGFKNLEFKGATFFFDRDAPFVAGASGEMYFINPEYLYLVVDSELNFHMTEFIRPSDQNARVAQILWMGELVCSNRSRQAVVKGCHS